MANRKLTPLALPARLSFFTEVLSLLKEVLFSGLEALICFLQDISSFRNFLVVMTFMLVIYIIQCYHETPVTLTALGFWATILAYYFKLRQDSQK